MPIWLAGGDKGKQPGSSRTGSHLNLCGICVSALSSSAGPYKQRASSPAQLRFELRNGSLHIDHLLGHPAVHYEVLAGDEAGLVGDQKSHQDRNVPWCAHPPGRVLGMILRA